MFCLLLPYKMSQGLLILLKSLLYAKREYGKN